MKSLEEENSFQADAANISYSNTMIMGGNVTQLHEHSNVSMHFGGGGGDDTTFNFRGNRQSFDLNFSNLVGTDQSLVQALKEAFQFYLRKDEVSIFFFSSFLAIQLNQVRNFFR